MAYNIVVDPNNMRGPVSGKRQNWTGGPVIAPSRPTVNNWTDATGPVGIAKKFIGHFGRGLFGPTTKGSYSGPDMVPGGKGANNS